MDEAIGSCVEVGEKDITLQNLLRCGRVMSYDISTTYLKSAGQMVFKGKDPLWTSHLTVSGRPARHTAIITGVQFQDVAPSAPLPRSELPVQLPLPPLRSGELPPPSLDEPVQLPLARPPSPSEEPGRKRSGKPVRRPPGQVQAPKRCSRS
jgi:hypothetical protein